MAQADEVTPYAKASQARSLQQNMPLSWFDLTDVQAFTDRLVDDLHKTKTGGAARGDKMGHIVKRLDKLIEQAVEFESSKRLNIYKKARMLALVRSGLAEKGWKPADTGAIVNQLLTSRLRKPNT